MIENTIEINFHEEKETIDPDCLAQFLLEFNDIYRIASNVVRDVTPEEFIKNKDEYVNAVIQRITKGDLLSMRRGLNV